jgi:hypothetical protein
MMEGREKQKVVIGGTASSIQATWLKNLPFSHFFLDALKKTYNQDQCTLYIHRFQKKISVLIKGGRGE